MSKNKIFLNTIEDEKWILNKVNDSYRRKLYTWLELNLNLIKKRKLSDVSIDETNMSVLEKVKALEKYLNVSNINYTPCFTSTPEQWLLARSLQSQSTLTNRKIKKQRQIQKPKKPKDGIISIKPIFTKKIEKQLQRIKKKELEELRQQQEELLKSMTSDLNMHK